MKKTEALGLTFTLAAGLCLLSVGCPSNIPPDKPEPPTGPSQSSIGTACTFAAAGSDQDQHAVILRFDWDDGDTSDWSASVRDGDTVQAVYIWSLPDTYYVSVQAQDSKGENSLWSNWHRIIIADTVNIEPGVPAITSGPDSAFVGQVCDFTIVGTDPNLDRLQYKVDWTTGDTLLTALVPSGTEVLVQYAWPDTGLFYVRAQSLDERGLLSAWSVGREIVISDTLKLGPR